MKRDTPEQILQRQCVQWLELACPPPPEGPTWTAVNPVPAKSMIVAKLSKALGMRAGWPDLILVHRGRAICIELKAKGGGRSRAQRELHEALTLAGAVVATISSFDDFVAFVTTLGMTRRAA